MTDKLQALYKAQIEALAAIVNVHTTDKLYNLEAIPRDPVMVQVQKIRTALDVFMTASKLARPTEPVHHQCPGIPRKGCNYLAGCGQLCNKCGRIHAAHLLVTSQPTELEAVR